MRSSLSTGLHLVIKLDLYGFLSLPTGAGGVLDRTLNILPADDDITVPALRKFEIKQKTLISVPQE